MVLFKQKKRRTLWLWALLLSVLLLSVQGVKLHVHSLDHDLEHSQIGIELPLEHSEQNNAHLSSDFSHEDHHDGLTSELETNSYGLKKVSSSVLTLALFATVLTLFHTGFYRQIVYPRRNKIAIFPRRYINFPPLRAPPL